MNSSDFNLVCILGPTACGKTSLAVKLAYLQKSIVVSADSRQIYKDMNIGTGKDIEEYTIESYKIPYKLIDIREAGDKYNLYEYCKDFYEIFDNLSVSDNIPILCGGTGMYIEAILKSYNLQEVPVDEELRYILGQKSDIELEAMLSSLKQMHNISDTSSRKRLIRAIEIETYMQTNDIIKTEHRPINCLTIGIDINRDQRRKNISIRLKQRLDEGMIDEVKKLLDKGIKAEDLIYYGLEYKFITYYLINKLSYNEMFTSLETAIHQFAKRQMTYFRKMENDGIKINWIDYNISNEEKIGIIQNLIINNSKY